MAEQLGARTDHHCTLLRPERHDAYAGPPADTLTVRALALPAADLARLLAPAGRLVVLGNVQELVAALAPLLADAGKIGELGARARESVVVGHSLAGEVEAVVAVYRGVLAGSEGRGG